MSWIISTGGAAVASRHGTPALRLQQLGAARGLASGALFAALLGVVGCDGDNLFKTGGAVVAPEVDAIAVPPAATAGETIEVTVSASGQRNIASIAVSFRGAAQDDITITIDPTRTPVTESIQYTIPVPVQDSLLVVSAIARDIADRASDPVSATVRITDVTLPTVTASADPVPAHLGGPLEIRVNAADNVGLSRIGYLVITPAGDTIGNVLATTSGKTRDTTFTFIVPPDLPPTSLTVVGLAVDVSNQLGTSAALVVALVDLIAPAVTILEPQDGATFPLGDSVLVRVRAVAGHRDRDALFAAHGRVPAGARAGAADRYHHRALSAADR
jgi:hypothetical protein